MEMIRCIPTCRQYASNYAIIAPIHFLFVLTDAIRHTPPSSTTTPIELQKDYRTDELSVLKANGLSEDEINLYIPKTTAEKNKLRKQDIAKHTTDFDQLKMDVATLKEQIKFLEK